MVAEGEKQANILRAEGQKQGEILAAEGQRAAQALRAEGFGVALKQLGTSPATKFIFPMEFTGMLESFVEAQKKK